MQFSSVQEIFIFPMKKLIKRLDISQLGIYVSIRSRSLRVPLGSTAIRSINNDESNKKRELFVDEVLKMKVHKDRIMKSMFLIHSRLYKHLI